MSTKEEKGIKRARDLLKVLEYIPIIYLEIPNDKYRRLANAEYNLRESSKELDANP